MFRPWAFHSSQPPPLEDVQPPPLEDDQPPPLEGDPTGGPSRTVCPSHTGSDPYHYELPRPDLLVDMGPIDVAPTDMPELFDIVLSDVDDDLLHNEISTALGSAYLSETPHLTSPHATVNGIVFGRHDRVLFPLVVRLPRTSRSYVIHFLYGSGSPFTFLSQEVCGVPKHL
jgi:hypothetical protein